MSLSDTPWWQSSPLVGKELMCIFSKFFHLMGECTMTMHHDSTLCFMLCSSAVLLMPMLVWFTARQLYASSETIRSQRPWPHSEMQKETKGMRITLIETTHTCSTWWFVRTASNMQMQLIIIDVIFVGMLWVHGQEPTRSEYNLCKAN